MFIGLLHSTEMGSRGKICRFPGGSGHPKMEFNLVKRGGSRSTYNIKPSILRVLGTLLLINIHEHPTGKQVEISMIANNSFNC
jgi:hypothetical protein